MTGEFLRRKTNNAKKWVQERPYYIRRFWNRKLIRRRDFTIISNNCWAGKAYQYLDMPYLSPTVGLYFFAEDYLKFVSNLRYYLSLDLIFISAEESRYVDILRERSHMHVPVGRLGDVEIIFLHYKTEEEAKEKWDRRKQRVNYDNIILKFSKMNLCTEAHMYEFESLSFENKFMLGNRKNIQYTCEIYWDGKSNEEEILSDTSPFPGRVSLTKIINKKPKRYPKSSLI